MQCLHRRPPAFTRSKTPTLPGITGQDGSYLAELLLEKGYTVHGIIRRASTFNTYRINHLYKDPHTKNVKLHLHYGDLTDSSNLCSIIGKVVPTEIYNLGAQSHVAVRARALNPSRLFVGDRRASSAPHCAHTQLTQAAKTKTPQQVSFEMSEYTANTDALGTLRLLNAINTCRLTEYTRFYQASTSELYGKVQEIPQKETTPFYPRSPYGVRFAQEPPHTRHGTHTHTHRAAAFPHTRARTYTTHTNTSA